MVGAAILYAYKYVCTMLLQDFVGHPEGTVCQNERQENHGAHHGVRALDRRMLHVGGRHEGREFQRRQNKLDQGIVRNQAWVGETRQVRASRPLVLDRKADSRQVLDTSLQFQ